MKESFINRKRKGSGEYEDIFLEGIELLQQLSGEEWTDFNEHDPGVTILENIAYTLTDLSFKSKLPIQDLLRDSKGSKLETGDNGMFIPGDILTTAPITIEDYRKLIIDQVSNVKNVWIKSKGGDSEINNRYRSIGFGSGIYRVFVEVYEKKKDPVTRLKDEQQIVKHIKSIFNQNRNICEDLLDVLIYDDFSLKIKLKLNVARSQSGEEILANILYKINDFLNPEINFYSLSVLEKKGMEINEIFDGPNLEMGFIQDEALLPKVKVVIPSDILKIISSEPGVKSVDYFNLFYTENEKEIEVPREGISVPNSQVPLVEFPSSSLDILFENDGVEFQADLREVQKQLSFIQAVNYGDFRSVAPIDNQIEIPEGKELNVDEYYPLRNQLPLNYGIGDFGLQTGLEPKRYAQANQLKAYLLPLDQLMYNFLSQLSNLYDLYNPKEKEIKSYYSKALKDMPNLVQLIQSQNDDSVKKALKNWDNTVDELNTLFDSKMFERMNDVADSLIARFSERFPSYALRKINVSCFGKNYADDKFETSIIGLKRKLIQEYGEISYNRMRSYDFTENFHFVKGELVDQLNYIPSILKKSSILLGIEDYSLRSLTKPVIESDFKIYKRKEGLEIISERLEIMYSKNEIDVILVDDIVIIDENVENLKNSFYFLGASGSIFEDVLRDGVLKSNYSIKTTGDKNGLYYVIFTAKEKKPHVLHVAESQKDAEDSIHFAIEYLTNISMKSEGVFMLEHNLLTPSYESSLFGFSILLPLNELRFMEFEQNELKPMLDRNACVDDILQHVKTQTELIFNTAPKLSGFVVQVLDKTNTVLAISKEIFNNEDEAKELADQLKRTSLNYKISQFDNGVFFFSHYGENKKIDESFFPFSVSFVLPKWPVRFQQNSFKKKFTNIIVDQLAAHIKFQSVWLDFDSMISFENIYFNWLELNAKDGLEKEKMELSFELISFLQKRKF